MHFGNLVIQRYLQMYIWTCYSELNIELEYERWTESERRSLLAFIFEFKSFSPVAKKLLIRILQLVCNLPLVYSLHFTLSLRFTLSER